MTVVNLFGEGGENVEVAPSDSLNAEALDAALVAFFTATNFFKSTLEDPLASERAGVASAIMTYLAATGREAP